MSDNVLIYAPWLDALERSPLAKGYLGRRAVNQAKSEVRRLVTLVETGKYFNNGGPIRAPELTEFRDQLGQWSKPQTIALDRRLGITFGPKDFRAVPRDGGIHDWDSRVPSVWRLRTSRAPEGDVTRFRADDDVYSVGLIGIGTAHATFGPEDEERQAAGRILVPDPEQRRGWRERYVYAEPKPGAERRPLGFQKP